MESDIFKLIIQKMDVGNIQEALDLLDEKFPEHIDVKTLKRRYIIAKDDYQNHIIDNKTFKVLENNIMHQVSEIIDEVFNKKQNYADFFDGDYYNKIRSSTAKANLQEAIYYLNEWINTEKRDDPDFDIKLKHLEYEYTNLKKSTINGTASDNEITLLQNRLFRDILRLTDEIKDKPKIKTEQKAIEKKIESSAASFVQESISELSKREKILKFQANFWYIVGFLSICSGVWLSIEFMISTKNDVLETLKITYLIFKSLFIIALLIAAARYAFNLGKIYMNEALKNADRIHAISFGKFYLQVFGANIKPEDLKEVFKDWNTNQESPFVKLDSSEFDPKLMEAFLKFAEVMKPESKK